MPLICYLTEASLDWSGRLYAARPKTWSKLCLVFLALGHNVDQFPRHIDHTRETHGLSPNFKKTIAHDFDMHNIGAVVGLQLKFGAFVLTPEIVAMYSYSEYKPAWLVFPGLSLGASW